MIICYRKLVLQILATSFMRLSLLNLKVMLTTAFRVVVKIRIEPKWIESWGTVHLFQYALSSRFLYTFYTCIKAIHCSVDDLYQISKDDHNWCCRFCLPSVNGKDSNQEPQLSRNFKSRIFRPLTQLEMFKSRIWSFMQIPKVRTRKFVESSPMAQLLRL